MITYEKNEDLISIRKQKIARPVVTPFYSYPTSSRTYLVQPIVVRIKHVDLVIDLDLRLCIYTTHAHIRKIQTERSNEH